MPEYRLLFLRESHLEWWETIEAPDHLAAIREIGGRGEELKVEVWGGDKRLAVVRPAKHGVPSRRREPPVRQPVPSS